MKVLRRLVKNSGLGINEFRRDEQQLDKHACCLPLRIGLIDTSPSDLPGSMTRYADLLETVMKERFDVKLERLRLAPTAEQLRRYPQRLQTLVHHATIAWRARRISSRTDVDLYHIADGSHAYLSRWLSAKRMIVTAHDTIPLLQLRGKFPVPPPSRFARWLIHRSLAGVNRCHQILAVSQSTAADLIHYAGSSADKVVVVPLAVSSNLRPPNARSVPDWNERKYQSAPFLLHIGNNGFYKNRLGVVRVFDIVQHEFPIRLKLAGPPPDDRLRQLIAERNLESQIEFIANPDDEAVKNLYRTARLLLFPSIYEGFGWPPLEAMAWGCPVVCTRAGSLGEIVGDAAFVGDPDDESGLAAGCLKILQDQAFADQIVARGHSQVRNFSVERFRDKVLAAYRSVASSAEAKFR